MEDRTVQDFVEDMVSDCRSWEQILTVASNSQWRNRKGEIKEAYRELKKRMRKCRKEVEDRDR